MGNATIDQTTPANERGEPGADGVLRDLLSWSRAVVDRVTGNPNEATVTVRYADGGEVQLTAVLLCRPTDPPPVNPVREEVEAFFAHAMPLLDLAGRHVKSWAVDRINVVEVTVEFGRSFSFRRTPGTNTLWEWSNHIDGWHEGGHSFADAVAAAFRLGWDDWG